MSRKICVQFEVRDMLIMKDTLKQLGYDFTETSENQLEAHKSYYRISIDGNRMSYDHMIESDVDQVRQAYMVNFYRDKAIREGNQIHEETNANGEVVLNILR